jgi:homoaconitase/3-isopropylmalate dehydratase large subunit
MTEINESELMAIELNAKTGEITSRELTPEEVAEKEQMKADAIAEQNAKESREEARASALAKLAALGLTEEEIAAL